MASNNENSVPTQNNAKNTLVSEVIGNKTDTVAGTSLVSLIKNAGATDIVAGLNVAKTSSITESSMYDYLHWTAGTLVTKTNTCKT